MTAIYLSQIHTPVCIYYYYYYYYYYWSFPDRYSFFNIFSASYKLHTFYFL